MWRRRRRLSPFNIHAFGATTGLTSTVVRRQSLVTSHRQLQSGAKVRQLSHFTRYWFWKDGLLFKGTTIYMKRAQEAWFSPTPLIFYLKEKEESPYIRNSPQKSLHYRYRKAFGLGKKRIRPHQNSDGVYSQELYTFSIRRNGAVSSRNPSSTLLVFGA